MRINMLFVIKRDRKGELERKRWVEGGGTRDKERKNRERRGGKDKYMEKSKNHVCT